MVASAGSGVDQSTGDTGDEQSVGDTELDGVVQRLLALLKHAIQLGCLSNRSRETVKDETDVSLNVSC